MRISVRNNYNANLELEFTSSESYPKIYFEKDVYIYNNLMLNTNIIQRHNYLYKYCMENKFVYWPTFIDKQPIAIEHTCLNCLYIYHNNYSHFLIQCIGSYLVAKAAGIISDHTFILIAHHKTFHKKIAEILNINPDRIISPQYYVPYLVKNIIYTDLSFSYNYHKDFISLYNVYFDVPYKLTSSHFYITRKNQDNRKMKNEVECINLVKQYGYATIDFDRISIEEQILHMRNAQSIIMPHGAAGANLVFLNSLPVKVVEIFNSTRISSIHSSFLQHLPCDYSALSCCSSDTGCMDSSYNIDLKLLINAIDTKDISFTTNQTSDDQLSTHMVYKYALDKHLIPPYQTAIIASDKYIRNGNFDKAIDIVNNICKRYADDVNIYKFLLELFIRSGNISHIHHFIDKQHDNIRHITCYFNILALIYSFSPDIKMNLEESKDELISDSYDRLADLFAVFESAPSSSLLTFHHTTLACSVDESKLVHSQSADNALAANIQDAKTLYLKLGDQYIQRIGDYGHIALGSDPAPFQYLQNGPHNISILKDGKYLSARKGGAFGFMPVNREWEHFWLKPE